MTIDPRDYEGLLDGLSESREHLRVMEVSGEQQVVDLAKAFYRIDSAAAAIRELLNQTGEKQMFNGAVGSWLSNRKLRNRVAKVLRFAARPAADIDIRYLSQRDPDDAPVRKRVSAPW